MDEGSSATVYVHRKVIEMSTTVSSGVITSFPELLAMIPDGAKLFAFFAFLAFLAFLAWLKQGRK